MSSQPCGCDPEAQLSDGSIGWVCRRCRAEYELAMIRKLCIDKACMNDFGETRDLVATVIDKAWHFKRQLDDLRGTLRASMKAND